MANGTPLWFVIIIAILTFIILIGVIGLWVSASKIKKGAGYKGGTGTSCTGKGTPTCPVP